MVFVLIDALRRDVVTQSIMPFLSSFSRRCLDFRNAYSVVNATDPSLTSMFTGYYPSTHGLIHHGERVEPSDLSTLQYIDFLTEILKRNGYKTIALDFLGRWHKRGFDRYINPGDTFLKRFLKNVFKLVSHMPISIRNFITRMYVSVFLGSERKKYFGLPYTAGTAFSKAESIISKLYKDNNRFFLFIHLWDTHIPYNASEALGDDRELEKTVEKLVDGEEKNKITLGDLKQVIPGPWIDRLINQYDSSTLISSIIKDYLIASRYVDSQLNHFIDFMEEKELLEKTIIIITSDHGESLGEHNIWFDHHGLYEPTIQTPLIIYTPEYRGKIIDALVQHIDLMPLLLEFLGIKYEPPVPWDGLNIIDILEYGKHNLRTILYAEEAHTERKYMIRMGKYKYITALKPEDAICRYCNIVHGGVEELYDLEKDPREEENLIELYPDIAAELRSKLMSVIKELSRKRMRLKIKKLKRRK